MRAYILAPAAETDLEEIEEYTALRWGDAKAAEYINDLFDAFELLADTPGIAKPRAALRKDLRLFPLNRHAIIFKIDKKTNAIYILRVLHSAMNIKAGLNNRLTHSPSPPDRN